MTKQTVNANCVECSKSPIYTKYNSTLEVYLCDICKELEKYTLIYKTSAKNNYFLTIKELDDCEENCDTFNKYNSTYHRGTPTTLFRLSDILDIFCNKYQINRHDNLAIENKKKELELLKEMKKDARQKNLIIKKEKRKTNLINALAKYKLKLRPDSKLCNGYIDGTINDWTIDEIVKRMCEMKYLYDYCDIDDYFDKAYEEQQEELRAGYFPDCTVFEQAEHMAINKKGGYPNVWPWMNE